MAWVILASLVWIGLHIGVAGSPLRAVVAARLGDQGFQGVFSAASIVMIALLAVAYRHAPFVLLWAAPPWLRWLVVVIMLPACLLLVASLLIRNPTAVGGTLDQEPRGILRVTRHPMLWSFALWAALHILATGDLASIFFFGAFLITALAGMPSIDSKIAARDPPRWRRFAAATSIIPFRAIAEGRNRLILPELGFVAPVLGLVLWGLLIWLHPYVIGVPAIPS